MSDVNMIQFYIVKDELLLEKSILFNSRIVSSTGIGSQMII